MRLFTAIFPPHEIREIFARLIPRLQERIAWDLVARLGMEMPVIPIHWVRAENLHLTLKFLGEIPVENVPTLQAALAAVQPTGSMHLRIAAIESIPRRGPIRVIAAGLDGDVHLLAQLQERIETACEAIAIPRDRRAFHAHITLARLRAGLPRQLQSNFGEYAAELPGDLCFETSGFSLVQSELLPGGPQYRLVERFGG